MKREVRTMKRVLSFIMAFAMMLTLLPATVFATETTKTIYLKAGVWDADNAWFDAWVWGSTTADTWYTFADSDGDLVYEIEIPADATGMKILRKDPAGTDHDWESWNNSGDLTISGNCYTVTDWSAGSWGTYDPATASVTFTVAGDSALCGSDWDTTDTANDMAKNDEGLYEKVYSGIAVGTYQFKIAANHAWTQSWGDSSTANGNMYVAVSTADSDVTITFNSVTKEIVAAVTVPQYFTVAFNPNNGTTIDSIPVKSGEIATAPADPTWDGYTFDGWYTDDGIWQNKYTFTEPVEANVVLFAKWVETSSEGETGGDSGSEETETITVYFQNNWLWTDVCVYAFDAENQYVGTAWPGVDMTFLENDGSYDIYFADVPADVAGIVFSGIKNDGSGDRDQSPNITTIQEAPMCYYMTWSDGNQVNTFNYTSSSGGEGDGDGTTEATYIVAGTAGLCGTEWDVSNTANKMTLDENGLYTITYASVAAGTHSFKVTDGTWDNSWGGTGTDGNYEFTLDAISNVTISFNANTKEITVATEATGEETVTSTYTAIFHFANTIGWSPVNLYVWNNDGATTSSWPGSAITKQDENGYHTTTVSWDAASYNGLNYIFNNGSVQTIDLALDDSYFDAETNTAEVWVELDSTANSEGKYVTKQVSTSVLEGVVLVVSPKIDGTSVTFEYAGDSSTTSVEVRGTVTGATWENGIAMSKNDKGLWTVTVEELDPAVYEYKFFVNGETWTTDPANGKTNSDGNSVFTIVDPDAVDANTININVYYDREDGIYTVEDADGEGVDATWNAYVWGDGIAGTRYDFAADDNGDMVTTITVTGRETQNVYLKTRLSTQAKEWLQEESQVSIALGDITSGTINVYVTSTGTSGDKGDVTYSVISGTDITTANKITDLQLDYDTDKITVTTLETLDDPATALEIYNTRDDTETIGITSATTSGSTYTLTLNKTLDLVTLYQYKITFEEYDYAIGIDTVYASDKFAEEFTYTGTDLGATYTSDSTKFVLWAPTAEAVSVNLYTSGTKGTEDLIKAVEMTKGEKGVWSATVSGDLNGTYYTYAVTVDGETIEAVDPYARTTGVNGNRGMVIDLASTDPEDGWSEITNKPASYTDAVIYELHVRDFSIDDSSGVKDEWQGKFLGLTQTGTTSTDGKTVTGLDYLKDLGITHLHLLPIYDYASVDETTCNTFNWGYDPQNYNTPEGSYSTDPYNGEVRVKEMKEMVDTLHENNIGVIMDVVYNHVYDASTFCFNQIVPGYFSRVDSNRSGCGNDTASEREMVRKYIVESVLYWAEEYHIDGFRFDLVGLLDVETINQIVEEVHAVREDIIFYGEGWDMDGTNKEPGTEMAKQGNSSKTPDFAYFSDNIRNLLGGNNGNSTGFVSGQSGVEGDVVSNFMANPWWTSNPEQVIQYASCHDNYTLIDKLIISTGASGVTSDIIKMNNLAAAIYMTAQGVPFIHAGEEFLREKLEEDGGRCENSYNASDYVNHIEWSDLENAIYAANSAYYKGLIAFRKAHPALRYATAAEVADNIQTWEASGNVVAMQIDGNGAGDDDIFVIFNANSTAKTVTLPDGEWTINIKGTQAGTDSLGTASGSVSVDDISAMVLTKTDEGKDEKVPLGASDAKTIYFSNNKYWDKVYAYVWDGNDTALNGDWPGKEMTYVETNDYGEDIYSVDLPASETGVSVIFNNGSNVEQTVDVVPGIDGIGYYCSGDNKNADSKWEVGTYTYRAPNLGTAEEYFLVGYINGVDYVGGNYQFDEDGKITVKFNSDSYIYVVNGDSSETYMTDGWLGYVTSATLYDTDVYTNITADKLFVPGGTEITFILTVNDDDNTVTLSYETATSGVEDNSGIQDGVTLHCWNWSFSEIEKNMATIAAQGYTAIQTSPIQPLKEATNQPANSVGSHWWVYYQPVDFDITTDAGNALGTKEDLVSMIETAHEYGIKVIVDVVANHLGNETGNDLSSKIPEYLLKDEYWHDITTNITDWNDRYDMTQHSLDGLPDLNTANDNIQNYVLAFLKECVDIGVDGFRFDMAKSIETPSDDASFASDFWPTVIGGIQEYAGDDLYIYGEVLDNPIIAVSAYTEYMSVTDNSWGNNLRNDVASGNASMAAGYHKAADASNLVIWVESHDTYATDEASQSSANVEVEDINKTWALVAARADAMGLYLARPESTTQALGVASATGWDNAEVKAVNEFHNAFVGQSETIGNSDNISYVVRGTTGIVMVNTTGTTSDVSISVKMDDGVYYDRITDKAFTVKDGVISGTIGDTGIAVVRNVKLNTSNMTLGNDLALNFWVMKSDLETDVEYTAIVTRGETKTKFEMNEWIEKDTYYQIPYEDFAAKEMTDEISVQIFVGDQAASNVFTDSIRSYAMFMLKNSSDAELKTALVDMLNYGAAAQLEFGYNTANLANSFLTEEQQALATDMDEVELEDSWKGNGIGYGSNLELKDNIILNIWFKNADVESVKISYTNHYGKVLTAVVNEEDFTNRGIPGVSSVAVDELFNEENAVEALVVADGGQVITCTFYGENNEVLGTVTESIESYLAYMLKKTTDSNNLYEATAKFITSAYNYFH